MANILIVDDNAVNRSYLTTLLGYGGHTLTEAGNGEEAMAIVEACPPDLIISDILMPVADGYELLRRLRAHATASLTPVIFYTAAYHSEEARPLATTGGATRFLIKPAEPEVVLLAVNAALSRPRPSAPIALDEDFDREHMRLLTDKLARKIAELEKEVEERKRAEAERDLMASERAARIEAERTSRIKDEFLATLSHELRTPLNAVIGWCQLFRYGGLSDPEKIEAMEIIERNSRAQARLIEDLLDTSRIMSGKIRLDIQRVDFRTVIGEAVETVRASADAKGITIVQNLGTRERIVMADQNRLQQVVWNLLANAIKFTPPRGHVEITLDATDSMAEVIVTDTGQGIEEEFLPHVFERFRQADGSTKREHGGLGLGLSIVKHLTEVHGGTVSAASDGKGCGARFVIRIPLLAPACANGQYVAQPLEYTIASAATAVELPSLAGVKVLIVDDEPDARKVVGRLLTECKASVTTAASVKDALEAIGRQCPDVLVSDIGMPGEDGYVLIKKILASPVDSHRSIPSIALTAFARPEDRALALQFGFREHITKPLEPAKLILAVALLAKVATGTGARLST